MPELRKPITTGVTFLDISFILVLVMAWFFMAQVWANPMAGIMLSVSLFILAIYVISRFTGFLGYMRLTIPTWTISGLIAIPIMKIFLAIMPSSTAVAPTTNVIGADVLESIIGKEAAIEIIQLRLMPITESLLVIFMFAFFMGVALRHYKYLAVKKRKGLTLLPYLIVAAFGSLIHTGIATKLRKLGFATFNTVLIHQFLSFLIFVGFGLFFMAPAIITSHMIKNHVALGASGSSWFITFAMFIGADLISILLLRRKQQVKAPSLFK